MNSYLEARSDAINTYCRKWKIVELSMFGSVLPSDFNPDSDVGDCRIGILKLIALGWTELQGISRAFEGADRVPAVYALREGAPVCERAWAR